MSDAEVFLTILVGCILFLCFVALLVALAGITTTTPTLRSWEKRGYLDFIVTLSNGKSYRGGMGVWDTYPAGDAVEIGSALGNLLAKYHRQIEWGQHLDLEVKPWEE